MSAINILIADDEIRMRKLVSDFLKRDGYHVMEAANGRDAVDLFESNHGIDLVVLDIMMPEMDGWTACREIRKKSDVPIIMLTARSQESDELLGFSLGTDEYITKPFSPMILVARIHSLLRRTGKLKKEVKSYSRLKIDEAGHNVLVEDQKVDLSPKEFQLLTYLAANEGIALSRDQILNSVWDFDYFGDGRTVDTHVKKLRLKLGNAGDYIQTVRGLGYKFEV